MMLKDIRIEFMLLVENRNSLSIIDMIAEKMIFEISLGAYPHSIDIDHR